MNQKKLVQAFKAFFQKSVSPYVSNNEYVISEWRNFDNIISADQIDYSQLDFYIGSAQRNTISSKNSPQLNSKFGRKNPDLTGSDKKHPQTSLTSPKKNLLSCLQSFQTLLIKNQQKLQSLNRKQVPITSSSGLQKRYG